MANPRKFSEKIALHNQKQAEETAAFEKIMREVSDATNKVSSGSRRTRVKTSPSPANTEASLTPVQQGLGEFRGGSLPNVAVPQAPNAEPEIKPEEATLATQYVMSGARSGGTSPSRSPGQRGRASSSVGPMRSRPAERKHDTSPYGSTVYLSPPQSDSSWRRSNSDSALHQSYNEQPPSPALSPHHPLHSHAHPHHAAHHHHRRATTDIHLDGLTTLGVSQNPRPRSSCEMPRVPNNTNYLYSAYDAGGGGMTGGGGGGMTGGGGGGLCAELQVPGGSLPDLTSVHFPPPPGTHHHQHQSHSRANSPSYGQQSPRSGGAVSPGAGSISPATGGRSPASGSPVGATVPDALHSAPGPAGNCRQDNSGIYDAQNHLSVPNTNNYLHHSKNQNNMSPIDHAWITSSYQSHCSPPSQYSSTSNINIPSPTMVHSPGSPVESPQNSDYSNLHQALLQPFEQITMLDGPPSNYSTGYINHSSPVSPQPTSSPHTYSTEYSPQECDYTAVHRTSERERDPVPGGNAAVFARLSPSAPPTPASIPDIILTDYSGGLDASMFGGEEAQLRAGLDLDELTLLEEPAALLPDSAVEHEFRLDRL